MANTNATGTQWNCPNYTGELFLAGANQTPFLNMMGGLNGGRVRQVGDWQYDMAQPWSLEAAAQPAITETSSLTAPTAWTYVRAQQKNTVQIYHRKVALTYAKMSVSNQITATTTYLVDKSGIQPVGSELDFQVNAHMKQVSKDFDYVCLNGSYQLATSAAVAAKTKGIITGVSTNTVNASSARLSKSLLNQLLRTMAGNGAPFDQPVIFVNAFNRQLISDIYGYAPPAQDVGGVKVSTILTDFAEVAVVYAPAVPAATLLVADMAYCKPTALPVPGKGVLFYEELARSGAGTNGQLYGQLGIDYGYEGYHGTITSLATS